ncbi:MAG: hypothetical protein ACPGU1_10355 [Myxococcota bacterium]
MKFLILCLLLSLTACGEATSTSDTADVTISAPSGGDALQVDVSSDLAGCEPTTRVCEDDGTWSVCNDQRTWGPPNVCEAGTTCLDGHCRVPLCTPESVRCASWTVRRRCEASGLKWAAPEPCGTDEICHEGQCLTCFPGEPTCATLVASAICGEDGVSFPMDDISSCGGEERCHEPTGICLAEECTAGDTVCSGILGLHDCLPSGTRFSPEVVPCGPSEVCSAAGCTAVPCAPYPVLFLVDRTGAVGSDWSSFQAAIEAAQDEQPSASLGFMPFPMAFGCPQAEAGALPRFPVESAPDISEWFSTVTASAGEAALEFVFQTILDRAHEIFAGNAGRIILISSGEAECGSNAEAIGAAVAALRIDHAIQTYVIGHRASSGPYDGLEAAHAQGGSSWETWRETSYDLDLTQAVLAAMQELPTCNSTSATR